MLTTAIAYREITPRESVPLIGYGDRTHDSEGVHDPLYAYAWWLQGLQGEEQEPLVWIVVDLCVLSVVSARRLAQAVGRKTGVAAGRIMFSATHTHSGPDTAFIQDDGDSWAGERAAPTGRGAEHAGAERGG